MGKGPTLNLDSTIPWKTWMKEDSKLSVSISSPPPGPGGVKKLCSSSSGQHRPQCFYLLYFGLYSLKAGVKTNPPSPKLTKRKKQFKRGHFKTPLAPSPFSKVISCLCPQVLSLTSPVLSLVLLTEEKNSPMTYIAHGSLLHVPRTP